MSRTELLLLNSINFIFSENLFNLLAPVTYNSNNFILTTSENKDVGNMPAELCNAIAPLYDAGLLNIVGSKVSFVEPISKRSRYAKQAILFVEMEGKIKVQED